MIQLVLGGTFFYKLCRLYGAHPFAAYFAGLAYAFSPFVASHIGGHYNLVQVAAPAAALYFSNKIYFIAAAGHSARRRLLYSVALGVSVGISCVSDIYLGIMLLLLLILLLIINITINPHALKLRRYWNNVSLSVLIAALIATPWAVELVRVSRSGDFTVTNLAAGSQYFATWTNFVLPAPGHLIYNLFPTWAAYRAELRIVESTYLGITLLATAAIGLASGFSRPALVLITSAFALGVILSTGNAFTETPGIPKPYNLGRYWPSIGILAQFRVPARWQFFLVTILALGISQGLSCLLRNKNVAAHAMAGMLAAAITLDLWPGRLPLTAVAPDPAFREIPIPEDGTLLTFPIGIASGSGGGIGVFSGSQLVDQMLHKKPLVSAYLARMDNSVFDSRRNDPELLALIALQSGQTPITATHDWTAFIERYNISHVALPNSYPAGHPLSTLINQSFTHDTTTQSVNFRIITLKR